MVTNTDAAVKDLDLNSVLSWKPLASRGGVLAACLTVALLLTFLTPQWFQTGLNRYLYPMGSHEWPRTVSIIPISGNEKVAIGESVTLNMRIARGLSPSLRGLIHLRDSNGTITSRAMRKAENGSFSATIDAVTEDVLYWFEAGDDSTERRPLSIQVVKRPEVIEALVSVEPPSYATDHALRTHDLSDGPVSVPVGGVAHVALRVSKPVLADHKWKRSELQLRSGAITPLTVSDQDPSTFTAKIRIQEDVYFNVALADESGFENYADSTFALIAAPDNAPIVTIVEPKSMAELTPSGSIEVVTRIEDDFGIAALALESTLSSTGATSTQAIPTPAARSDRKESALYESTFRWSLAATDVRPGDVIVYHVAATDDRGDLQEGQVGRSASMRLKIISDVEFEIRVRDELAQLERRLRQTALDQSELLDQTVVLERNEEREPREKASQLAAQQGRLGDGVISLARQFEELTERMKNNGVNVSAGNAPLATFSSILDELALGPMTTARESLNQAAKAGESVAQKSALLNAAHSEQAVVARLRSLIRSMSEWGDFQELVARSRDLLDRQTDIRHDTAGLNRTMLGRSVESLDARQQSELKRVERRQSQLANDIEGSLARMRQLLERSKNDGSPAAEAIEDALRVARSGSLTKSARSAANSIRQNRTAGALMEQKRTADTLRRLVKTLHEKQKRELARLRKQLTGAEELIAQLIEEQHALRDATDEAGKLDADQDTFTDLSQTQRVLKQNAKSVGLRIADIERAAQPERLIRKASTEMGDAELALKISDSENGTAAQQRAADLLQEALRALEALSRQTAQEELHATLADIRKQLEDLAALQRAIRDGIGEIMEAIEESGRAGRSQIRLASKLARNQLGAQNSLQELMPELEKVPVYLWSLQRVSGWMDQVREALTSRRFEWELSSNADRIVRTLDQLIDAIDQTTKMPIETEFAEAEQGGGKGASTATKPLPTVAELLVIKTMQMDINSRTMSIAETIDRDDVTDAQLRALRMIGEDQLQIEALARQLSEKAREP